jgi:hypothetical protein
MSKPTALGQVGLEHLATLELTFMGCAETDISTPAIAATARREGHSGGVLLEHDTGDLDTADCNNPPFHRRPGEKLS